MEILFELVFEILGQFILEVLIEGGFRGLARFLSNRIVKAALGAGLAVAAGYAGGYWWGSRLTEVGRTDPPTSLWVSIGLAAVFLAIALVQALRRASRIETVAGGSGSDTEPYRRRIAERLVPWRWSVPRLLGFALLNAAAAAGVAAGFSPRALG